MARALSSSAVTEKNKSANRPVMLYTVFNYDGNGNDLNLAGYPQNVVFDGITYQRFPVGYEAISENVIGEIDSVRLTLGNVSRLIQSYLEAYEWRGKKVRVRMVFADLLSDANAKVDDLYYIDGIAADEKHVNVMLTSRFDVLAVQLPGQQYNRLHCRWKTFKGQECGYTGPQATCNRTWQQCKEYGNHQRFGAFPSIPTQQIVIR